MLTNRNVVFSWGPATDPASGPVFYELIVFRDDEATGPVAARLALNPQGPVEQDAYSLLAEPLESSGEVLDHGGGVSGGVVFVEGLHGQGAQIAGSDSIRFPAGTVLDPTRGTVEMAARLNRNVADIEGFDCFLSYRLDEREQLALLVAPQEDAVYGHVMHEGIQHNALAAVDWTAGEWHHLAFTWGPEGQRLYLDGGLAASSSSTSAPNPGGSDLVLGNDTDGWGGIDAVLDDLRISRFQRVLPDELRETHSSPVFLDGGYYEWQVRAVSTDGSSEWSSPVHFQVDDEAAKPVMLTDRAITEDLIGLGAEWDALFFMDPNVDMGIDEAAFDLTVQRMDRLGLSLVRMFVNTGWWEPEEGRTDFDDPLMVSLYRQLEACDELGIPVLLVIWRTADWLEPWSEHAQPLARTTADLLEELEDRGYDAVHYLTLINEPNLELDAPFSAYAELVEALDTELEERDLDVLLTGPDETGAPQWFEQSVNELAGRIDVFDSHSYEFDLGSIAGMDDFVAERLALMQGSADAGSKPFIVAEFGSSNMSNTFHSTDIDTFERGLFSAEGALRAMNGGASAIVHWCLHDMFYYTRIRMEFGLWRFGDEDWSVRPIYHAWGLVSRLAEPGSRVLAMDMADPRLVTAAVQRPDCSVALWAVNRDSRPMTIEVVNAMGQAITGPVSWYRYEQESLPEGDEALESRSPLDVNSGRFQQVLPPATLTAFVVPMELDPEVCQAVIDGDPEPSEELSDTGTGDGSAAGDNDGTTPEGGAHENDSGCGCYQGLATGIPLCSGSSLPALALIGLAVARRCRRRLPMRPPAS